MSTEENTTGDRHPSASPTRPGSHQPNDEQAQPLPPGMLADYPWLTFLLPFVVYMLVGGLEPTPQEHGGLFGLTIPYAKYPIIYTIKIALTIAAMLFVVRGYLTFPWQVSWLGPVVGVVGVVLWIALCRLNLEAKVLGPVGLSDFGERGAYNPLHELEATPAWAYTFLVVRFFGLAILVPIMEEFFLRGFLMRFVMDREWWRLPFGVATPVALFLGTLMPMLMHPAELLAALVWFSMVHWLMLRTRTIWDCVIAHAVTNFLLGLYVVTTGHWELM